MAKGRNQQQARFGVLRELLQWEGELRNVRVQSLFRVRSVQASRLITQFAAENPGLLRLDTYQKRWIPVPGASLGDSTSVDEYLADAAVDGRSDSWFEDARSSFQDPDPQVFAALRAACTTSCGVELSYRSMSHPEGMRRRIFPHAIVRLSQRWHVRAWCVLREQYRDFTLGRIKAPTLSTAVAKGLPEDKAWLARVDIRIGAHRGLSGAQEQTIRDEYFAGAVARRIQVRGALVNYVINDLRAAIDPKRQLPPEYQLEVLNEPDLRPYLFSSHQE